MAVGARSDCGLAAERGLTNKAGLRNGRLSRFKNPSAALRENLCVLRGPYFHLISLVKQRESRFRSIHFQLVIVEMAATESTKKAQRSTKN